MRVLFDHGIITHAEFADQPLREQTTHFDNGSVLRLLGFRRKPPHHDPSFQAELDALFTIGRLTREGRITAYHYSELMHERMRDHFGGRLCNALRGCRLSMCDAPIERSWFRSTLNHGDFISKGGKKDRNTGGYTGDMSQVAFFEWLCSLTPAEIAGTLSLAQRLGMPLFQQEGIRQLPWFQELCKGRNSDHYPDLFHVWTAERNQLDAFLTLDRKLTNIITQIRKEKRPRIMIKTLVLEPRALLQHLKVEPDPVPVRYDTFYPYGQFL